MLVAAVQGFAYTKFLYSQGIVASGISPVLLTISTMLVLVAGTIFVMWLGEQIQERGLGNGTSIIIMSNIISRLPGSFGKKQKQDLLLVVAEF